MTPICCLKGPGDIFSNIQTFTILQLTGKWQSDEKMFLIMEIMLLFKLNSLQMLSCDLPPA